MLTCKQRCPHCCVHILGTCLSVLMDFYLWQTFNIGARNTIKAPFIQALTLISDSVLHLDMADQCALGQDGQLLNATEIK